MTAEELLAELDQRGLTYRLDEGRLLVGGLNSLPPALVSQIKAHKAEIIALLAKPKISAEAASEVSGVRVSGESDGEAWMFEGWEEARKRSIPPPAKRPQPPWNFIHEVKDCRWPDCEFHNRYAP